MMFQKLRKSLLKLIYRSLILRTIILNKSSLGHYNKLKTFCSLDVETSKGTFVFVFKEDPRKKKRYTSDFFSINNFLIELIIPQGLENVDGYIQNKIIIVVKIMLFKVDYTILAEVLTDVYLDSILSYVKARKDL